MKNFTLLLLLFPVVLMAQSPDAESVFQQKAKAELIRDFNNGRNEFWIMFHDQADVSGAKQLNTKEAKGNFVYQALTQLAAKTQAPFIALLESKGAKYHPFWVVNAISVEGDINLAKEIAQFPEVKELLPNTRFVMETPIDPIYSDVAKTDNTMVAIEWGINKVKAPQVWALGYKGQGVVVGGQDTGYEFDHLALETQYRGYSTSGPNHNFNWHDAIHSGSGGSCGTNSTVPCDDHNHGTHTMGTICGDDGAGNQIGMAPQAKWIGARNMDQGVGTPTTYIECFQWFLAPTDINNQNATPSKAPHVINNSWGCDASEGCNSSNYSNMETAINNLRAAGVVVVVSAGNDGSACNTINGPPAHFAGSFTIGSTTSSDGISGFSSRGNIQIDNSNRIKPDVCAPGSSIRSSVRGGNYATYSGTSMAGPHVAGAVALLISAVPSLAGQVDSIQAILEKTAVKITSTQTCNGTSPSTFPNNTVGHGRIDILAAVNYALSVSTTSVQETSLEIKGLTAFPSPATDALNILFDGVKDQAGYIQVYNTSGQLIESKDLPIAGGAMELNVSEFAEGLYILRVHTGSGIFQGTFMKQ